MNNIIMGANGMSMWPEYGGQILTGLCSLSPYLFVGGASGFSIMFRYSALADVTAVQFDFS
jgi:hypothetical protein